MTKVSSFPPRLRRASSRPTPGEALDPRSGRAALRAQAAQHLSVPRGQLVSLRRADFADVEAAVPAGEAHRFPTPRSAPAAGVRIRALTAPRRIRPTSPRCRSARQSNPGRGSTYRRGNSVQRFGFRLWWRQLTGSDTTLDNAHVAEDYLARTPTMYRIISVGRTCSIP
jgi:hypothetical protein